MNNPSPNQANPYAPPKAFVQDVAEDNAPVQPAGRLLRLGAVLLDSLIPIIPVYAPLLLSGIIDIENRRLNYGAVPVLAWVWAALAFAAWIALTIYFVVKNSQTVGKKLLGIKVVRKDGSRIGIGRLFWMRNVLANLPAIILGGLWTIIDSLTIFGEQRQCIHDKIADTIVVTAR